MKRHILFALVALTAAGGMAAGVQAAETAKGVSVRYKNITLAFHQQPAQSDKKSLPFIEAAFSGKERYGMQFGGTAGTTPVLEVMDSQGKVLQSLSVNDLLGKGVSKETSLLPGTSGIHARKGETVYTVRALEQDAQIIVRALATGEEGAADQRLVVTFALKSAYLKEAALRLRMPASGSVEESAGGFMLVSYSGTSALAASVLPQGSAVALQRGKVTITTPVHPVRTSGETPMLWLVMAGVSSSSPTDVRTHAARVIAESRPADREPRVVIVSVADREKLTQSDTAGYTLICANIGAGEATDVILGNPIPKGSRYVPGSGTTSGMELREERGNKTVEGLKWISADPLLPGEERIVHFKVTVQ